MARLSITTPDGKRSFLELTKPLHTIGRGSANDLVLNDTSVSRFHAVVKQVQDEDYVIADRGSTNGVLLHGKRIQAELPLLDGDVARIGIYQVGFERVNEAALVVKSSEMPSAINEIMHGGVGEFSMRLKPAASANVPAELASAVQRLEKENYLLRVLYDAGKAVSSKLSADDIASQVIELSFRIEGVERGFMMLFGHEGQIWHQTEVKYRHAPVVALTSFDAEQSHIILGHTILERIKREQQPILINDVSADDRFSASESLKISGLRSAMCAPLIGSQRLLGILYVDNLQRASAFTQEELNVFSLVASQAAAAIDNAMAHVQLAENAIQRSALERFLSPEVVEMVTANPEGVRLGGVNQMVSVLFADIRGFTSLSERMAPEQIVEILNEYFTRVTDVIFDMGGTLDKYIGDAVMAIFGAPISKGKDADNAVRAALEIQRLLVEMNRDAAARQWPVLGVGIGINSGIVTAGNIGSPKRLDYTVIGDTVNTASRLMSKAAAGQVIISNNTVLQLQGAYQMAALPPLQVKGKSEPLAAFQVEWERKTAAGAQQ